MEGRMPWQKSAIAYIGSGLADAAVDMIRGVGFGLGGLNKAAAYAETLPFKLLPGPVSTNISPAEMDRLYPRRKEGMIHGVSACSTREFTATIKYAKKPAGTRAWKVYGAIKYPTTLRV